MKNMSIENLNPEELQGCAPIFQCIFDLFHDFPGTFVKLNIDGENYLLQRDKDLFALYSISDGNMVSYEMFVVDDEYNVTSAGFDDFEMHVIDGQRCLQYRNTFNIENLVMLKRSDGADESGYDGTITYIQYNQEHDVRLSLIYQQMYDEKEQIHGYQGSKVPFQICVEKGVTRKNKLRKDNARYLKVIVNCEDNRIAYDTCAIREYGMSEFLQKGSYNLHKERNLVRYYKIIGVDENGYARLTYPLGVGYSMDMFKEEFTKYGFKSFIPEDLINIHNDKNSDLKRFQEIANFMKKFELGEEELNPSLVLHLEGDFGNGKNS